MYIHLGSDTPSFPTLTLSILQPNFDFIKAAHHTQARHLNYSDLLRRTHHTFAPYVAADSSQAEAADTITSGPDQAPEAPRPEA